MIGIILLCVGYMKNNASCPPQKIEYRYIAKSFEDESDTATPLLSIAGMNSMFTSDSPWIQGRSYATTDVKNKI